MFFYYSLNSDFVKTELATIYIHNISYNSQIHQTSKEKVAF
jgi:hypothetical protein